MNEADLDRVLDRTFARVQARLRELPERLARQVVGVSPTEAEAIIGREVDEIRNELRTPAELDEPAP